MDKRMSALLKSLNDWTRAESGPKTAAPEQPEFKLVEELAIHMEMDQSELESWQARFQASKVKSLDEVYTDHSLLFQDVTPSPEEATHMAQLRRMLKTAISRLPEREALVLQLYYVEELNVYEVAAILGVTTGRVSQIKRAAIERAHSLIMEQMQL